jgi:capsular polysaccharide biosynthesis protein
MSQQSLNLRSSFQIVRRNKTLIGAVAAIGLICGASYGSLNPPMLTSQALVVLPTGGPAIATEVVVAQSMPVLSGALPNVSPAMSVETLRAMVQASSQTNNIVQITVAGASPAQAEANANAVANSYVAYINSSESPVGRVVGRMLAPAQTATGTSPLAHRITFAVVGALAGLVLGYIIALARGRNNRGRRLRLRDEIANSIGIPVLASLPASQPSSATDWGRLLTTYEPRPVHAWRLRKALQQLTLSGVHVTGGWDGDEGSSVAVVSLANDSSALSLGPQLAVFASSLGIPTALVVGPHQDPNVTATLQTACAELTAPLPGRPHLQLGVAEKLYGGAYPGALLAIVVGVADPSGTEVAAMPRTTATVLGVTAGAATADQLARVAVSLAAEGRDLAGILVANPDPVDQTTGRIPQLVRMTPPQVMPTRVTGTVTEAKR